MGTCRLGLAVAATVLFIALQSELASANGALALGSLHADASMQAAASPSPLLSAHFHKSQSFYCYPKTYWWFYRPYLTAQYNYARCMPYFHYLAPADQGGRPPPDRYIK